MIHYRNSVSELRVQFTQETSLPHHELSWGESVPSSGVATKQRERQLGRQSTLLREKDEQIARLTEETNRLHQSFTTFLRSFREVSEKNEKLTQENLRLKLPPAKPRTGAWIGVRLGDVGPDDLYDGVAIRGVMKPSPAQDSGLKEGDIIVMLDDTSVTKQSEVTGFLKDKPTAEPIKLKIARGSTLMDVTVQPSAWPQ